MLYTEQEFQVEIDGLKTEVRTAQANVADFSKRHFYGVTENALIYCLSRVRLISQKVVS